MGRIVINHSTYIDGLLKTLKKLAKVEGIKTVTPGAIAKTKGKCPILTIRISSEILGGYKLIARKGSSVQEVFVISTIAERKLKEILSKV